MTAGTLKMMVWITLSAMTAGMNGAVRKMMNKKKVLDQVFAMMEGKNLTTMAKKAGLTRVYLSTLRGNYDINPTILTLEKIQNACLEMEKENE